MNHRQNILGTEAVSGGTRKYTCHLIICLKKEKLFVKGRKQEKEML